jgi:Tol biopolymer transport system component/actin-like ATPase involved in cell morphogenesis
MSEPILAIDFGTTTSAAVLVAGADEELIEEPSGQGRTWPSAVSLDGDTLLVGTTAERRKRMHATLYRAEFKPDLGRDFPVPLGDRSFAVPELITAMLKELRTAGERVADAEITRAVLTVPASYGTHDQRSALMIEAATAAGFEIVELLSEPVAAALAPAAGAPLEPGSLILVYDFGGGTFDTALLRIGTKGNEILGHAALDHCGGRDIDAALYEALVDAGGEPLADLLKSQRARVQLTTQARNLKHQLTDAETADDYFGDTDILLSTTRDQLDELALPLLDRTIDCVKALLVSCDVEFDEVDAVLLVGGVTRMPIVTQTVEQSLGRPLRYARSPELAVVQGAARFAGAAQTRFAVPAKQRIPERPLRWRIPGDSATLLAWQVSPGDAFQVGQSLGQVRLTNGAIWELRADQPGRAGALHAGPGSTVYSGDWLVTAEVIAPALLASPELLSTAKHSEDLNGVAFHPNGIWIATVSDDKTARIWDARNGSELRRLAHGNWVYSVVFSTDGLRLASGSRDESARIWEVNTGRQLSRFECGSEVNGVSFSPDGRSLATAADKLTVWNIETSAATVLTGELSTVEDVCFSPDGVLIASAHPDGSVLIWDFASSELITTIEEDGKVHRVAFSPDSTRVAAARENGSVSIWDATTGAKTTQMTHSSDAFCVAFSPDGTQIATGGHDDCARVWDASTGEELTNVDHAHSVYGVAFSPDGKRLATASWDDTARIWQIR